MDLYKIILNVLFFSVANSLTIKNNDGVFNESINDYNKEVNSPDNVFNGVYSECFMHLSYSCLQKKTLLYLKELNNLSEVSVLGDYVKFVKINTTTTADDNDDTDSSDELAFMIDKAVDEFFDNHVLKFNALGRDISIPRNMEFVGRKKRKGGGGGGGGHDSMMMGGHFGHDDGGKKKMMMMAMMCMKMKLMMMVPAMMGMMGMMSFKGMMFSMMSFMISKMMLLMKILEKKGGAGGLGGGAGGGDGGWAAGGGGGGAWMPAGGQDFGGGSGGYDANAQWQSRSIAETLDIMNKPTIYYKNINSHRKYDKSFYNANFDKENNINKEIIKPYGPVLESPVLGVTPEISFIKPAVRYNDKIEKDIYKKPVVEYKMSNVEFNSNEHDLNNNENKRKDDDNTDHTFDHFSRVKRSVSFLQVSDNDKNDTDTPNTTEDNVKYPSISYKKIKSEEKSRSKRSLLDLLQNSYAYWMSKILGINNNRRTNFQKYKIINGVKYVYYPFKAQRTKTPKEIQLTSTVKVEDQFKPIITAEDFNKGEIMEGAVEARMNRKKFNKIKDTVNDTMEDNPWE